MKEAVSIRWGSHNTFRLNSGALEDNKCSPPVKVLWPEKSVYSASRGVMKHIKSSDKFYSKRNRIRFVEPSRCQVYFYLFYFISSHLRK